MSVTDERMFYLMLSATEGQAYAHQMGFQIPSEDVQKLEIMDILSRWVLFAKSGVYEDITESAEWFAHFLHSLDKISSPADEFQSALTVFAVSMLNKMVERGLVILVVNDALKDEYYD
jgi:hypothetical protein